jgi:ceramide glucosyltransferase
MALVLLGFAALVRAGRRGLRTAPTAGEEPVRWPRLAWIVPVAGTSPGLEERLATFLTQDYPDYQVIFAVRDLDDPAARLLSRFIRPQPQARLVVAGPARNCGQKNTNLLAGVKLAGEDPDLLVFADANQTAPPDFLRRLVAPVVRGEAEVASGYHHLIPSHRGLAGWGRALTVLTLYLTKTLPRLNQPWGGATAIRRETFYALGVQRLWGETVVDDVSLAARVRRAGLGTALAPGAALTTPSSADTWSSWQDWLFRQWIYLKFYLPGSWLAAGIFLQLAVILTLVAVLRVSLALVHAMWSFWDLPAAGFLSGLAALALALRPLHPAPPSPARWLAAGLAALVMASWVHLKTAFSHRITWRGLTYRMAPGGRVRGVAPSGV